MTKYTVEFSDGARDDLRRIRNYLADNNFDAEVLQKIIDKISILETRPQNYQIYHGTIYKINVLRKNTVYYEIIGDVVLVSRIRAGRMNVDL